MADKPHWPSDIEKNSVVCCDEQFICWNIKKSRHIVRIKKCPCVCSDLYFFH